MMTVIEQIDPELSEDGKNIVLYAWTSDPDVAFVWSVSLPMAIEEDNLLVQEWRELAWRDLMQQDLIQSLHRGEGSSQD